MRNHDFIKGFFSDDPIGARRIVTFAANDARVFQAASANDYTIGVSEFGATTAGQPVSVIMGGVAAVEYGGNVDRGALLTADENGKAVDVLSVVGTSLRVIGVAMMSGVAGDIGAVLIAPGVAPGAAD